MENKENILVIYYSYTGNSKKIAEYVQEKLNAKTLELQPVEPFSNNYDEVVNEWQNNDIKRDVEIQPINIDLSNYSKIVLVTGTWWYGITPVMKKFLKENSLEGKDVIVSATNAGWIGHCFKDYETLIKGNIKGKLDIIFSAEEGKRSELLTDKKEIDNWIEKL